MIVEFYPAHAFVAVASRVFEMVVEGVEGVI